MSRAARALDVEPEIPLPVAMVATAPANDTTVRDLVARLVDSHTDPETIWSRAVIANARSRHPHSLADLRALVPAFEPRKRGPMVYRRGRLTR